MTWAISNTRRRPGELLTRGDVCHLHEKREDAERCGTNGAVRTPDLVKLEHRTERVYVVVWSLSSAADGQLRRVPRPALQRSGPSADHDLKREGT